MSFEYAHPHCIGGPHSGDFTDEPDKSMAKAHESFVKGNIKEATK